MPNVAVITGSNGLIGQATCRKLTQSGFLTVGVDIGADSKGNWPYHQCDLNDLASLDQTFSAIAKDHGLIRVLYNNAGVFHPEKDWLDVPAEQFDATMSANVKVPFFAAQWVAKRLIAAGQPGSIITTASMAGLGMAGTDTLFDCSTRGRSRVVFHPISASTGDGSESR